MAILDLLIGGAGGGVFGAVAGVANNYLKNKAQIALEETRLKQSEADNKHELAMMDKTATMQANEQASKLATTQAVADGKAMVANIQAYTEQLKNAWSIVQNLSASVRFTLTYTTHAIILWIVYQAMIAIDTTTAEGIQTYMSVIGQTGIFGAYTFMVSFWFVNRSSDKQLGHK